MKLNSVGDVELKAVMIAEAINVHDVAEFTTSEVAEKMDDTLAKCIELWCHQIQSTKADVDILMVDGADSDSGKVQILDKTILLEVFFKVHAVWCRQIIAVFANFRLDFFQRKKVNVIVVEESNASLIGTSSIQGTDMMPLTSCVMRLSMFTLRWL